MSTYSDIGQSTLRWGHALVIGLNKSFILSPSHLGRDLKNNAKYVVWWGYQQSDAVGKGLMNVTVTDFSSSKPLKVNRAMYSDFGLYHFAPIAASSNITYLGELGKWVPVAAARTTSIVDSAQSLTVDIVGVVNEKVQLAFYDKKSGKASSILCTISASGTATATIKPGGMGSCK